MKKIALLLPCLLTGGTEVVTLSTAKAFKALGFTVDIIVYFDEVDPLMLEAFQVHGISVVQLGIHRTGGLKAHFQLGLSLAKALFNKGYSLVWLQYMTPTLIPLLVARCFTGYLVAAIHVAAGHYSQQGISRIRCLARHWCTRFVCVSHTAAKGIFDADWLSGVYGKKVVVVPNSLDTSQANAAVPRQWCEPLGWPRDTPIVGYCGRLASIKGADIFVEAVAILIRGGYHARFVMVGDGEERDKLQSMAAELGIGDRIHIAGRAARGEVYSAIKGFDIAVVPSRQEGFGLSALEAMACGVPLVASNADALSEIITHEITGLLFDNGSAVDLAAQVGRLLQDRAFADNLARQACQHACDHYNTRRFRSEIADMLESAGLKPGQGAL